MAHSHNRSVFVKSRRRKHLNKMTSSVVHLDLELNESVEVGDQAAPVLVDPEVEGDVRVPPCVDQEVEMLEIGKP